MVSKIFPGTVYNNPTNPIKPTKQDLTEFRNLLDCIKKDQFEEAYDLIKVKPVLLRIKGAPFTPNYDKTALWIVICEKNYLPSEVREKAFKLALQMIELDPYMDLNAGPQDPANWSIEFGQWLVKEVNDPPYTVLHGVLELQQKSELRTQLMQYLLLCGAAVPDDLTEEQKLEVQEAKISLQKGFACGQHVMKMRRIEGNVFANHLMPSEIIEGIARKAMFLKLYEEYPWLANFPRGFVLERMGALACQK